MFNSSLETHLELDFLLRVFKARFLELINSTGPYTTTSSISSVESCTSSLLIIVFSGQPFACCICVSARNKRLCMQVNGELTEAYAWTFFVFEMEKRSFPNSSSDKHGMHITIPQPKKEGKLLIPVQTKGRSQVL